MRTQPAQIRMPGQYLLSMGLKMVGHVGRIISTRFGCGNVTDINGALMDRKTVVVDHISIRIVRDTDGEIILSLYDKFVAAWNPDVDIMEVVIPYAVEEAFKLGQKSKVKEIKKALGIHS